MQSQIQIGELCRVHAIGLSCDIGIIVDTDLLMLKEEYEDNIYLVMMDNGSFEWLLAGEISLLQSGNRRNDKR